MGQKYSVVLPADNTSSELHELPLDVFRHLLSFGINTNVLRLVCKRFAFRIPSIKGILAEMNCCVLPYRITEITQYGYSPIQMARFAVRSLDFVFIDFMMDGYMAELISAAVAESAINVIKFIIISDQYFASLRKKDFRWLIALHMETAACDNYHVAKFLLSQFTIYAKDFPLNHEYRAIRQRGAVKGLFRDLYKNTKNCAECLNFSIFDQWIVVHPAGLSTIYISATDQYNKEDIIGICRTDIHDN